MENEDLFDFNKKLISLLVITVLFGVFLYLIEQRNVIEFDGKNLYVSNKMKKQEIKIPLEKIDKLLFSVIGLNSHSYSSYSYRIIYRDDNSKIKRIRLYPRIGRDDISEIIRQTKIKNPNVEVCNWSFGLNEIFE